MIAVTDQDIGRKVVYRPKVGEPEEGVITSYNWLGVFVRYAGQTTSKSTAYSDLEYLNPQEPSA